MSTELARPEIRVLKAYESARSLTTEGKIFLDANEAPLSPLDSYPNLNRYPEPQPKSLVERLSGIYQVPRSEMMISRGSDEAIDLIVRVFCESDKDRILICPPTYGMYDISAKIQGVETLRVPMLLDQNNPRLDEPGILDVIKRGVKIVFICSPNNPTGTPFSDEVLGRITEAAIGKSIVVVDEAYGEFSDSKSMITQVNRYPNLIVLRTLSKAWAIAGARCGVAIASSPLIELLQKVRAPYPLSLPQIEAILEGTDLTRQNALKLRVNELISEREKMKTEIAKLKSVKFIYPSATNFLLVQFENQSPILNRMKADGVVLRDRSSEAGLLGCIRITLGTKDENQKVLSLIQEALA